MLWCYGADGKLDPLYGKAREASFAHRAKMDSTNKKITSHGPLQHESLFPSGSKSQKSITLIHGFQCPACCIASLDVNLLLVIKLRKQM